MCGLLLNWCHPLQSDSPSRPLFKLLTYICIGLSISLVAVLTVYQFIQLLIAIWTMTTIHNVIPHFAWFIYLPFALFLQLNLLLRRKVFISFMHDWNAFESKVLTSPYFDNDVTSSLRSVRCFLGYSNVLLWLILTGGLTSLMYRDPEAAYLLTHYSFLRETFGPVALSIAHMLSVTTTYFFLTIADFVPTLVFYHAALTLRVLILQTESLFTWLQPCRSTLGAKDLRLILNSASTSMSFSLGLRQVWRQFEQLSNLIGRANCFFGSVIVMNHGIKLFGICSVSYSILYSYQTQPLAVSGHLSSLLSQVFFLVSSTFLASRLYCSSMRLRTTLAALLSEHWDSVPKDDHVIVSVILGRLQSDPLSASPLHMYQISPSLLLSIASLSITYLVILLQSK